MRCATNRLSRSGAMRNATSMPFPTISICSSVASRSTCRAGCCCINSGNIGATILRPNAAEAVMRRRPDRCVPSGNRSASALFLSSSNACACGKKTSPSLVGERDRVVRCTSLTPNSASRLLRERDAAMALIESRRAAPARLPALIASTNTSTSSSFIVSLFVMLPYQSTYLQYLSLHCHSLFTT